VSGWESDLLIGLAQHLDNLGVGTYRDDGTAYLASETAIVFGELPPSPDRCITLNLYSAGDAATENLSSPRINVKLRGSPNNTLDVSDLGTAVFEALQGLTHQDYGSAHLAQIGRVSSMPFEIDANRRHVRSDSYRTDTNTPSTSGRPE
jgi:hypothetical protein